MDNLIIEKIKLEDVDKIKNIEENQNINIISKNNIINDINNNQTQYFVLKINDLIIGYIAFDVVLENIDIQSIVIDKSYQKKGYASKLLEFAFSYATNNDVSNIFLEVRKSNIKAINLYTKYGFKYINTRKKYYPDNLEDALIYLKKL